MVLQALISVIYGIVENSWMTAALLLKYVACVQLIYAARMEGNITANLQKVVSDYSREIITSIVVLGTLVTALGVEFSTYPQLLSYSIALIYIGYLFWSF